MNRIFCILFVFLCGAALRAQSAKIADMAVISYVKKGNIILRWAPGNPELWKAGNVYGYKVERITQDQYLQSGPDSIKFKNGTLVAKALIPWKQDDERWKELIQKNKTAAFLFGSLYPFKSKSVPHKKDMAFAMLMKMCDLHKELSLAHGLIINDSVYNENEVYVYRISVDHAPKTLKYSPAIITVKPKELSSLARIETLKAKFGDRKSTLSFVTLSMKDYAGYWIERSEDSVNYQAVNKTPFIRATTKYNKENNESIFNDSLPVNNKKYFYRVRGISHFGEMGPPSNIVSGTGRPALNVYPFIDSTNIIKNASVAIRFHMPAKFDKTVLQGFIVYRSEKHSAGFTVVSGMLSPQSTLFVDDKPLESNYYKVAAFDLYGDSVFSLVTYARLIDETPPAIPGEPTGTIYSNGVVQLKWAANTEKDLLGYRVYRGNSVNEQPVELTKKILTQPSFKDSVSLQTLTREVFYCIRAVDKVYNNSTYGPYCKLIRPDKIKPVAPVFYKIAPTDSLIMLAWHASSSNDVKKYKLSRRENSGAWQVIKEWEVEKNILSLSDTMLAPGDKYIYRLEVSDGSGNLAMAETHEILYKPAFFPKIKGFKATVNLATRNIELNWNAGNSVYNYTLYKAKGKEPLQVFKTLKPNTQYFIDKELYPNNKYRYAIKATFNSGAETRLSEMIEVEF